MSEGRPATSGWTFLTLGLVVGLILAEAGVLGWAVWLKAGYQSPVERAVSLPVLATVGGASDGPASSPGPAPGTIAHCLAPYASDPALGTRVALGVTTLTGDRLVALGPARVTPASTTKLLTTTAALSVLGPDHRFTTTVVRHGDSLTLVGGGDPYLATRASVRIVAGAATLTDLADQVKSAIGHHQGQHVRLTVDTSLFPGPGASAFWEPGYIPTGVVSPISALWVEEGHVTVTSYARVADPAAAAGRAFVKLLRQRGFAVTWAGNAPADSTATVIASVQSPPVSDIVRQVLSVSDNEGAEVLARQVAIALGRSGSAAAAPRAVRAELVALGIPVAGLRIYDGSGLSRYDLIPVATLEAVLAYDAANPQVRPVIADLPVSRFSGTLVDRFTGTADSTGGVVHAKTGTLTGVSALAGYVVDADGVPLIFVAIADRVPGSSTAARSALDRIAASLAQCAA